MNAMLNLERPTLLVVDDMPQNVEVIAEYLSEAYDSQCAFSGDEALALLAQEELPLPDLILLDKKLPDGDGFDLLKKFKKLKSYLPVIILTAQSGLGVKKEALNLGANAFFSKPFNNSELITVIEKLLV